MNWVFRITSSFTLASLLLVASCSTTPEEIELLDKSFTLYEHALRWQDYDLVISFHKNEREKLTEARRKFLKRFRVTSYNVVYNKVEPDNKHALQVVEVKYYNDEYAIVRDVTLNNQWEYDEKANRWHLINDLPAFR